MKPIPPVFVTAALVLLVGVAFLQLQQISLANESWQAEYESGKSIEEKLHRSAAESVCDPGSGVNLLDTAAVQAAEAERHLRLALEQAQAAHVSEDRITEIQYHLSISLMFQGKQTEGLDLINSVKSQREKLHPGADLVVADCLVVLAAKENNERHTELAEDLNVDAYEMYLKLLPHNDRKFIDVLPALIASDDRKERVEYARHFVEVCEKVYGPNDRRVVPALEDYALALDGDFQRAEAVKLYEQARAVRKANGMKETEGISDYDLATLKKIASGARPDYEAQSNPERILGRRTQRKMGIAKSLTPSKRDVESFGIFDNFTMDQALVKAKELAESGTIANLSEAQVQWQRVLRFMRAPDWVPTAALVPVPRRFAELAEICLQRKMIADADDLMRGAYEFPTMIAEELKQVDASAEKLIRYYQDNNMQKEKKGFLEFALKHVNGQRSATYQKMLTQSSP